MSDKTLNKSDNIDVQNNTENLSEREETNLPSETPEELKKKNAEFQDQYIRLAADFENYRKRFAQERESLLKYGAYETVKLLIPLVNNFKAALGSLDKVTDLEKMRENFIILETQLQDILRDMGVEKIQTIGELFNPEWHQAIMQVETNEHPDQTILEELQPGYMLKDKVLSVAYVTVAKNAYTNSANDQHNEDNLVDNTESE